MKKFKTGWLIALIVMFALVTGSCELGKDGDGNPSGLDATNYSGTDRAFYVKNNSNKRLVVFRGGITTTTADKANGTILGVVPQGGDAHGIGRKYMGGESAAFTMYVLEESVYIENKGSIAALEALQQKPYTRLFVVYNSSGDNEKVYEISNKLGGENKLSIGNPGSIWNIELRQGGTEGAPLGFAPTGMIETTLYLADGDYLLFPVFHKYNSTRDVLETKIPVIQSGTFEGQAYYHQVALGAPPDGTRESIFNINEALNLLTASTSGAAWLVVNNQFSTGIRVLQGSTPLRTASGTYTINNGFERQYPINMDMTNTGSSVTFGTEKTLGSWRVGPVSNEIEIKDKEGNSTLTFKADMMYTLNVTGNMTIGITAEIEMRTGNDPETDEPYPGAPVKVNF